MWQFQVKHVGRYCYAQVADYITPCFTLGFTLSGLRWWDSSGIRITDGCPHFTFLPGHCRTQFEYGPDRENYAVLAETDVVQLGHSPGTIDWNYGGSKVALPTFVPVPAESVPGWQAEFIRLREAFLAPTPRNLLRVEAGIINVLRWVLDANADRLAATPAEALKKLLDDDVRHGESLAKLSRRCGYSADHLRLMFARQYGLTPKAYRDRRRLARAMELIANSRLSLKEIARATGFTHGAHFANSFRRAFGISPREGVRRFRHEPAEYAPDP
ncbi:MAG: helix-turn-helix domain-containing protein [Planctomycetes bacterium]|nr:helix-turn-helix domain-containing protein [Planctomycetota bacterium]